MRSFNNQQDGHGNGPMTDLLNRILKRLDELQFYDSTTVKVEQTTRGAKFHVRKGNAGSGAATNIFNEYDPTQSYPVGGGFIVSRTLVVDGKTVPKGIWGIPDAGPDVLGVAWAGTSLPANPTGVQVPQTTFVTGAIAKLMVSDCS